MVEAPADSSDAASLSRSRLTRVPTSGSSRESSLQRPYPAIVATTTAEIVAGVGTARSTRRRGPCSHPRRRRTPTYGVKRGWALPPARDETAPLPTSLEAALSALRADDVLVRRSARMAWVVAPRKGPSWRTSPESADLRRRARPRRGGAGGGRTRLFRVCVMARRSVLASVLRR